MVSGLVSVFVLVLVGVVEIVLDGVFFFFVLLFFFKLTMGLEIFQTNLNVCSLYPERESRMSFSSPSFNLMGQGVWQEGDSFSEDKSKYTAAFEGVLCITTSWRVVVRGTISLVCTMVLVVVSVFPV